MNIKREESSLHDVPRALLVLKVCLIFSIVVAALLIILAIAGKRNALSIASTFIPLVAIQYFFYLMAKTKYVKK